METTWYIPTKKEEKQTKALDNINKICSKVAEVAITYKSKIKPSERVQINSSTDAQKIFFDHFKEGLEHREEFYLMLLNKANKVLGIAKVFQGGVSSCLCDVKILFQYALKANASAMIISHNHPSGTLYPSKADESLTKRVKSSGEILGINLLDHIILTPEKQLFYSFADEGNL